MPPITDSHGRKADDFDVLIARVSIRSAYRMMDDDSYSVATSDGEPWFGHVSNEATAKKLSFIATKYKTEGLS